MRCTLAQIGVVVGLSLGLAGSVNGAIITFTNSTFDDSGTGFGSVLNLLTLQANESEWGSVELVGGLTALTGDATNTSQIVTVADLNKAGVSAQDFGVVFNINEPGAKDEVTIEAFTLIFYDSTGGTLFTASYNGPELTLMPVGQGTGQAGWIFDVELTAGEAALFFGDSANSIGMIVPESTPLTNTFNGPDNFYLIPAPGAMALMALAMFNVRRRRR